MRTQLEALRHDATREIAHWTAAANRLQRLEDLASPQAWTGLERYLHIALRRRLEEALGKLDLESARLREKLGQADSPDEFRRLSREIERFRKGYFRTETTLDFYADAINTRTSPAMSANLRACDQLAETAMASLLRPLGKPVPPALVYIDNGIGASILKAGLRLWDGSTQSPVAAIKIVRHNLLRPTSLIHEAGHQVAHQLDWNGALNDHLKKILRPHGHELADMWSAWASEIAADTFAFVHTGFASVAGLHEVLASNRTHLFHVLPNDPHPVGYLRLLLGTTMCRHHFGAGIWDEMARLWQEKHDLTRADRENRPLLETSLPLLPTIARACTETRMDCFAGKSLAEWLPPARVSPSALNELHRQAGEALFQSAHWANEEGLRVLALTGYGMAANPTEFDQWLARQQASMSRLGEAAAAFA